MERNTTCCAWQNSRMQKQILAMARVEMQTWQKIYEPEKGFQRGTIFCELDLPFLCEEGCR